jgi:ribosomal protein S18 acetylase RimI-like enzyme
LKIEKAKTDSSEWLDEVIKREFPYTEFNPDKIASKITDPKYLILVAKQENILTGFIELELFSENKEARLNAVFVESCWRGQKIGTRLVRQAINECKHKRIQRLFLLVKISNNAGKGLYKKVGLKFEKLHDKIIEGSQVEVWSMPV